MKRSAIFCLSLIAGALFVSAPVRAQQHETEAERIKESTGVTEKGPNIIWGWANFIILAGGLGYLIKKHAGPYFAQRSLEIRKGMADAEAERIASEAKAKMEDFVTRRTKTAEGKIALAEAQALADVRSAAANAAVTAATTILSQSVKGSVADDLLAKGITEVRQKLN